MGFLDRFFKGEEKSTEIKFSELNSWLDGEISKSGDEIAKETKPMLREILNAKKKIKEMVLELQELQYPDGLPKRFKNIIKTSKPEYVSSMLDVLDGLTVETMDYQSISEFQNEFFESLEKIAKISMSHGRYLPMAFERNLTDIQRETKNLIEINKRLKEKVESYGRISLMNKVKNTKRNYDEIVEQKKALKKKRNALKKDLRELNDDLTLAKAGQTRILGDKQLGKFRKDIEDIGEKKSNIRTTIHRNLTPLKRPLRKYRKLTDKRLAPDAEKSIDGYIEDPVEHFLSDDHLKEILEDMKLAIREGKIEIKNPGKTSRTIKNALEVLTPVLVDDYNTLLEKEKQIEEKIKTSPVVTEAKRVEGAIKELEGKIGTKDDESKAVEKREHKYEDEIGDLKKQLRNQLDEFDVTLTYEK